MVAGSGVGSRLCRIAMRSAYRSTRAGFSIGGRKRRKHAPLSEAQKAQLAYLRRLAPKPRKKKIKPRVLYPGK